MAEHSEPQHAAPEKPEAATRTATATATKELRPDPDVEVSALHATPADLQQRYVASRLYTEGFALHGRQADAIGLWGDGMVYPANGTLVDVDTLEVVEAFAGYEFPDGPVYANSRDIPAALLEALRAGVGTPSVARGRAASGEK
jgi:hypothetical protein